MLVLSRRVNETVVFHELGVTVRVLRVKGGVVRLGVEAPPAVPIVRGELESLLDAGPHFVRRA
jgi:carbon storage regulator CsrA